MAKLQLFAWCLCSQNAVAPSFGTDFAYADAGGESF